MLTFNSNLHPAESVDAIIAGVLPLATAVRRHLACDRIGLDLRLGSQAIAELATEERRSILRRACDRAGVAIPTINAFPLSPFQNERVKDAAYQPDWSDPQRLADSVACIPVALALSDEPVVTISTVPGSFKPWGLPANDATRFADGLCRWCQAAASQIGTSGRRVILCLEPEPWCSLETSDEVIAFWNGPLAQTARAQGCSDAVAAHLGICFDTCHVSLAFEDQAAAVTRLQDAGIAIGKCQFSAAPEVVLPDPEGLAQLAALAEPRFLHQTAARNANGRIERVVDLDQLPQLLHQLPDAERIRSHFHIPVFWPPHDQGLSSTIRDSEVGLRACRAAGCHHIAVETYTWSILARSADERITGTAEELAYMRTLLSP